MLYHSTFSEAQSEMKLITYTTGDATAPEGTGAKVLAHVCNDAGGWGRGFVLSITRRWPEPERRYRQWARSGELDGVPFALGRMQLVQVDEDLAVANIIGQRDYGRTPGAPPPIRYDALRQALRELRARALELGASVHMPRIGCGLAGGRWELIEPIIVEELCAHDISVTVYDLPK